MTTHSSETRFKGGWRFLQWFLVPVLITLLGFALNLHEIDSKSLWYDEFGTLTLAGFGGSWLDALIKPLTVPTLPKPPVWFFVTRIFLSVVPNDFTARLPAALFATLTIPLVYALGKTMFDRQVGMLGAFLLAIAPLQIRYAQEARMYAMLACVSVLSLYLFWRAVRTGKIRWWLGFLAASVLNLYVHQFAFLPLGMMALCTLWLCLRFRERPPFPFRCRHFLVTSAGILLLYTPMVPYFIEGLVSEEGLGGSAIPIYGELQWDLSSLAGTFRLFSASRDLGLVLYGSLFLLAIAILAFRQIGALRSASNRTGDQTDVITWQPYTPYAIALSIMWVVLPLIISLSVPTGHGVRIRYLIFMLPVYLLLVAWGLRVVVLWVLVRFGGRLGAKAPSPAVVAVTTLVLMGILGRINAREISEYYVETKQNWRDATWLVQASAAAGERIFVPRTHHRTGVLFYAGQWTGGQNLLTRDVVQILPKEADEGLLPPGSERGWLIATAGDEPPELEYAETVKPYYQLLAPTLFGISGVPQDYLLLAPVSYRNLAVMELVPYHPPSVRFWADDEGISQGDCTWLNWDTEYIKEIYLDGEGVVGKDRRKVCPPVTIRYVLEVIHTDGTVSQETLEIAVEP